MIFHKIKKPFTLNQSGVDLERLNEFRQKIVEVFEGFDVLGLLEKLNVEAKTLEEKIAENIKFL